MEFYESVQGYIATECPVCGTRLILRPQQAGSTLKCEMCYRELVIPREIQVRRKVKPDPRQVEPYAIRDDEPPPAVAGELPPASPGDLLPPGRSDEGALPVPQGPRSGGYDLAPSADPPQPSPAVDPQPERKPTSGPAHNGASSSRQDPSRHDSSRPDSSRPDSSRPERARGAGAPAKEADNPPRRRKEAFAVVCPKCNNRMYARLHQVGDQIACGDCGYVLVVPQPPAEAPLKALPKPDPVPLAAEPPEEPRTDVVAERRESPRATGAPPAPWSAEPPRWTFISGVARFLWQGAGPLYWGVLSGGLFVSSLVGALALSWSGSITGGYGGLGPAMIALFLIAAFGPVLAWTLSYGASCFLMVMRDTANGADELTDWPQLAFSERLGDLARIVYLGGSALSLAYVTGLAASYGLGPAAQWPLAGAAALVVFPFLTISSLESQRVIWPFSAAVLGSLIRLWWGWLLMYVEIAVLMAAWGATVAFTFDSSPYLTALWSSPVLAAAALISARLFGRLLWRATVQDADDQPPRPTVYERVVRSGE